MHPWDYGRTQQSKHVYSDDCCQNPRAPIPSNDKDDQVRVCGLMLGRSLALQVRTPHALTTYTGKQANIEPTATAIYIRSHCALFSHIAPSTTERHKDPSIPCLLLYCATAACKRSQEALAKSLHTKFVSNAVGPMAPFSLSAKSTCVRVRLGFLIAVLCYVTYMLDTKQNVALRLAGPTK